MVFITEEKLLSWTKPASDSEETRCDSTIANIRNCIQNYDFGRLGQPEIRLRGSYNNNTNVKNDSDVDMYALFSNFWYNFDQNFQCIPSYGTGPSYSEFRNAVYLSLRQKYGTENVKNGNKSLKIKSKSFIQIVHHYRNTSLSKIKTPIRDGILEIDPAKVKKHQEDGYSEVEHVAIFDEAQRAWTQQQLANWLSRKQGIKDFPMSEPEFLIWSLDLREDWAVIICLVGGGQEINTCEAGISEWLRAINSSFSNWNVFISDKLRDTVLMIKRNQMMS